MTRAWVLTVILWSGNATTSYSISNIASSEECVRLAGAIKKEITISGIVPNQLELHCYEYKTVGNGK